MPSNQPLMLLIHGCFGTPACFNKLEPYLEEAGYSTIGATYPSSNPKHPAGSTVQKDSDYIRSEYLLPLIEKEQKDVVLIVHSFGGVVGANAAVGLSKVDRSAQGLDGGIVGLIYIAANIVKEGQSLLESCGGEWPQWFQKDKPSPGLAVMEPMMESMYNDCDPTLEPELAKLAVPQGYGSLVTKASAPCWAEKAYQGRLAYIRTTLDNVNPTWAQDLWLQNSGVHWDVVSMESSHAVYISQPEKLATIIINFTQKFEKL